MDYLTAKAYIKSLSGRGIMPGLDTIKHLLSKLGNPEDNLRIVHVAGTNGKGSFGAYLSSVIESCGLLCSRFVSPCVGEYENTFLLNSKPVCRNIISECTQVLKNAICELETENIFPTQFEAETALAFLIFSRISPDYTIIECGMGGRDDATNAIKNKILSVITKISLDHTAFLGDTISEIAMQKAGIIRENTPVVSAIQCDDAYNVIKSVCNKKNAPLYIADKAVITKSDNDITIFTVSDEAYKTRMLGTYQPQNAALAIKAARILGISDNAIKSGIADAYWEYRFCRIGKFILDGAHNPDGAEALADSLKEYTASCDTAFVCACFADKNYEAIAKLTAPYASEVYCVTAPTSRGLDAEILRDTFENCGIKSHASKSLQEAIKSAAKHKNVVIFGTLSVLSEAKEIIERFHNDAAL